MSLPKRGDTLRILPAAEQSALRRLVGARVAVARAELGFTQRGMAARFDRSPSWVREFEVGSQWAPPYLLLALAEATGRSIGWFYGEVGLATCHLTVPPARSGTTPA